MTPEQFCYWLQGYTELQVGEVGITRDQWRIIQDHLKEVFHKVTPNRSLQEQLKPVPMPNIKPGGSWPNLNHQQPNIIC